MSPPPPPPAAPGRTAVRPGWLYSPAARVKRKLSRKGPRRDSPEVVLGLQWLSSLQEGSDGSKAMATLIDPGTAQLEW